jgi:hypothetical protein
LSDAAHTVAAIFRIELPKLVARQFGGLAAAASRAGFRCWPGQTSAIRS